MARATPLLFAATFVFLAGGAGAATALPNDASADAAKTVEAGPVVLTIGSERFAFVHVPKGTFHEGSPADNKWHEADETDHEVTLTNDVDMLETPVTRGQYAAFVGETGYVTEAEKGSSGGSGWNGTELVQKKEYTWRNPGFPQTEEHPVVLVTYADSIAFLAWFSAKTGKSARLPTEAEFERAARGGTVTSWYVGEDESAALTIGVFKTNGGHGTEPVRKHVPNAYGLYDMSGNVYEWCLDVYGAYPTTAVTDPENATPPPGEPLRRVLRGGSWLKEPKRARSAARYRNTPGSRNADNGFRFVLVAGKSLPTTLPTLLPSGRISTTATPTSGSPPPSTASPPDEDRSPLLNAIMSVPGVAGTVAVLAALLWLAFRKKGAAPVPPGGGQNVDFVVAPDGFRLRTPGLGPGSRVRYECVVNGVPVTDVVPVGDGPETFVYTGGTPSAIRILEVVGIRTDVRGSAQPQRRRHEPTRRRDDDDRPFGGFPSAY